MRITLGKKETEELSKMRAVRKDLRIALEQCALLDPTRVPVTFSGYVNSAITLHAHFQCFVRV